MSCTFLLPTRTIPIQEVGLYFLHMPRKGRTSRKRCHKQQKNSQYKNDQPVQLLKWMKKSWNFQCKNLCAAEFQQTGRGLLAKKAIKQGDVIVSIPKGALVGAREALAYSTVLKALQDRFSVGLSSISGVEALCIFLIEELRIACRSFPKNQSKWGPYILSLPRTFNHPVNWNPIAVSLLPEKVSQAVLDIQRDVGRQLNQVNKLMTLVRQQQLQLDGDLVVEVKWDEYVWAWCCVNTRCVYSNHNTKHQTKLKPSASDCYYLVPFLDLLNHSPNVQVKTGFNKTNQCFEITSMSRVKKCSQVFINYSAHGNDVLLTEYGFVCTNELNPNDTTNVELHEIKINIFKNKLYNANLWQLVESTKLHEDLSFSHSGVSWSLKAIVLFLVLWLNCEGTDYKMMKKHFQDVLHSNLDPSEFCLQATKNAKIMLIEVCTREKHKVEAMIMKTIKSKQNYEKNLTVFGQLHTVHELWNVYDTMLKNCIDSIACLNNFSEFFRTS